MRNLIFLSYLFVSQLQAQWEAGASFNYKSEIPKNGFGVFITRNLPVQFSSFGIKARGSFDFFFSDGVEKNYFNSDLHADIIVNLFYEKFQPFFGLSIGGSRYSANNFEEYIFFLGGLAGMKFLLTDLLHPFVEVYSNKYFTNFDEATAQEKISSTQIACRIGISIRF